jgi:anti-sigma B factor antagonist
MPLPPSPSEDLVRLRWQGELDLQARASLDAAVDAALASRPVHLVLDMRAVTFIDGAGLGVLVRTAARCADLGIAVELLPSRVVRRLVDLAGISVPALADA